MKSCTTFPSIESPTRKAAAARLTELLGSNNKMSYLRLGDGELHFLIQAQAGAEIKYRTKVVTQKSGVENALGTPGLLPEHAERLQEALEQCDYLDLYQHQASNQSMLGQWSRATKSDQVQSKGVDDSGILNDWTWHELGGWLRGHRCLFCGSESALLEQLLNLEEFRSLAVRPISKPENAFFLQPRNHGRTLGEDLDQIKEDIRSAARANNCDTLLLSLGGAAKIIGYELAREENLRVVDFGSMMRALTYSGSDGNATWRAAHNPFFYRVPLSLYYQAANRAWSDLPLSDLCAKALVQLCLELQRKEVGRSFTSDVHDATSFDPSPENLRYFQESKLYFETQIVPQVQSDAECVRLINEFQYWCLKKGIGVKGKAFLAAVKTKGVLRSIFRLGK